MHVERLAGQRSDRGHNHRTPGYVRYEMAVHDIDVNPVGALTVEGAHLFAEPRYVGRQDGWRDDDCGHVAALDKLAHGNRSVAHTVGEPPFIVVPGQDADEIAVHDLGLIHGEVR